MAASTDTRILEVLYRSLGTVSLPALAAAALLAACTGMQVPDEPVSWSPEWFQCESRFECIVVYDAYCKFTPVNAEHARMYEQWAHQEVRRHDEQIPCPPANEIPAPVPLCRRGECDVF
jgi:hypothetical protein